MSPTIQGPHHIHQFSPELDLVWCKICQRHVSRGERFGEMIHRQAVEVASEAMLLQVLYGLTGKQSIQAAMCLEAGGKVA